MNRREENRFSMFLATDGILGKNQGTVDSKLALARNVNDFRSCITEIKEQDGTYQTISKGATAVKHSAEDSLIENIVAIAGVLYVYGKEVDNKMILETCALTESRLKRMRDTEIAQTADMVISLLDEHVTLLVDYDLTQKTIDELIDYKVAFENALQNKEVKFSESKDARAQLNNSFQKGSAILKNIDKLIELVRKSEPDFYNQYHNARMIIDLGLGTRKREEQADN